MPSPPKIEIEKTWLRRSCTLEFQISGGASFFKKYFDPTAYLAPSVYLEHKSTPIKTKWKSWYPFKICKNQHFSKSWKCETYWKTMNSPNHDHLKSVLDFWMNENGKVFRLRTVVISFKLISELFPETLIGGQLLEAKSDVSDVTEMHCISSRKFLSTSHKIKQNKEWGVERWIYILSIAISNIEYSDFFI